MDKPPQTPQPPPISGTTESIAPASDEARGRFFPCDSCGADLKFHIGQQQLVCSYCGYEKQIEFTDDEEINERHFEATLRRLQKQRDEDESEETSPATQQQQVRCDGCGANVVFVGSLTSSECPYCATPLQRENVHTAPEGIPVDAVLSFRVDRETARAHLVAWVKSRWFAPNLFRRRGVQGTFNGVYIPYWTFDTLTGTQYSGQRGEHYYVTVGTGKNKRQERRTRWYSASGSFERFFDDVLVLAATGMPHQLMQSLEPWPLESCVPFTHDFLAGFMARTYETELADGFQDARVRIDAAIDSEVRSRIGGDVQRVDSIDTGYAAITFKHLLLPVWLLAYRFHEKTFRVMVNAGSGEVQGERPYSWIKITLAIVAATLVGAAAVIAIMQS